MRNRVVARKQQKQRRVPFLQKTLAIGLVKEGRCLSILYKLFHFLCNKMICEVLSRLLSETNTYLLFLRNYLIDFFCHSGTPLSKGLNAFIWVLNFMRLFLFVLLFLSFLVPHTVPTHNPIPQVIFSLSFTYILYRLNTTFKIFDRIDYKIKFNTKTL